MQLFISTLGLILLVIPALVSSQAANSCYTPDEEPGYCVPSHQCTYVKDLRNTYGRNVPRYIQIRLIQMACNIGRRTFEVCCPSASVITPHSDGSVSSDSLPQTSSVTTRQESTNSRYIDPRGMEVLESLSRQCGNTANSKVSGGYNATLGEFPWLALLKYETSETRPFLCGGSLITDRFVLTAAHCVENKNLIGVRMGDYDLSNEQDCKFLRGKKYCLPPYEEFGIEDIRPHPNYKGINNDIALIKLDRPVKFKRHIKPICLPIDEKSQDITYDQRFFISGWGRTEKNVASSVLLKAVIKRTDLNTCRNFYVDAHVSENHICAVGDGNLHTCHGDSGGPLFIRNYFKNTSRFVQYGIISFGGKRCGQRQNQPGVFASVLDLFPWITQNLN